MKVLTGDKPYVPSWAMTQDYLTRRFLRIKKEQEAERKKKEELAQRTQRPEEWK